MLIHGHGMVLYGCQLSYYQLKKARRIKQKKSTPIFTLMRVNLFRISQVYTRAKESFNN